jgi:hypothetical protein
MESPRVKEHIELHPDEKIAWVLDKDLLYRFGMKHEVFRLLENAYPSASHTIRERLLERVCEGPESAGTENLKEKTRQYEIYNLLVWLNHVAPNCELAARILQQMQEAHPDFAPRDHPDMSRWMYAGFVQEPSSPYTVDELLALDPWEIIDELLSYQGEDYLGEPDRRGLLNNVAAAAARHYLWSKALSLALEGREAWDSDLWTCLLDGWREGSLEEPEWEEVLDFLQGHSDLYGFTDKIAHLLKAGIDKPHGALPTACLPLAESLAAKVWVVCDQETIGEELPSDTWFGSSTDLSASNIVEFWLHALSRRQREAGESWSGLPEGYIDQFKNIIDGTSSAAQVGKALLAGALHFLFAIDADWTRGSVLPVLDWSDNPTRAQQAWRGFLTWGRWSEGLLPDLLPLYEQATRHVSSDLADLRERFSEQMANIAFYSSSNPVSEGWLSRFIAAAEPEERKSWAFSVGGYLRQLEEEGVADVWSDWLSEYWTLRNSGIPASLDPGELEEMIEWSLVLAPVFPEVVEKILSVPAPNLEHSPIYLDLAEKDYTNRYPDAMTKLLKHLLTSAQPPFSLCADVATLFRELLGRTGLNEELKDICDQLGRLGCPNAAELNNLLEH